MTKPLRAGLAALILSLLLPGQLLAAGDDLNLSLCKQLLSRLLCKKTNEFGYVGKLGEGIYIISVFYASKQSEYLCALTPDGQAILQDRTWRATRRVVPYSADSEGKCLIAHFSSPECPAKGEIKVCPPKTKLDAHEQAKETFWNRPVPKILEEEYKAMGEKSQNATTKAPQSEGEGK